MKTWQFACALFVITGTALYQIIAGDMLTPATSSVADDTAAADPVIIVGNTTSVILPNAPGEIADRPGESVVYPTVAPTEPDAAPPDSTADAETDPATGAVTASPPDATADAEADPAETTGTVSAAPPKAAGQTEINPTVAAVTENTSLNVGAEPHASADAPSAVAPSALSGALAEPKPSPAPQQQAASEMPQPKLAKLEDDDSSVASSRSGRSEAKQDLSYLALYAYAEIPPPKKPADIVLESLKGVPIGTPVQEIRLAANAFGLDFNFMKTIARIESDFDPKQRTGSYIGLFQLSNYEFEKYGSGTITNPRDNAIAAAYKFTTQAILFELDTHKRPTFSDLYLIHQQGWQGAAEHVGHPGRIAWRSMCETDEGREKGEKWCKRAIWANTLPTIKHAWKSVENLTSAAFVDMWRQRINSLYARYSEAIVGDTKH
jgi:soluble lytic murein transglycosylase-like protein